MTSDEALLATAMETWSPALRDLLGPHDEVPLSRGDLVRIGASTPGFVAPDGERPPADLSARLMEDMAELLVDYPNGAHVRMGVCSFKSANGVQPVHDEADMRAAILRPNIRVAGFVDRQLRLGHDAALFLFPWSAIPDWAEFRVFFRGSNVVGASQATVGKVHPEIADQEEAIRGAIIDLCYAIRPLLPLPDAAVDLWVEREASDFEARLIEVNPFVAGTDPGLFGANGKNDFDGTFRFQEIE